MCWGTVEVFTGNVIWGKQGISHQSTFSPAGSLVCAGGLSKFSPETRLLILLVFTILGPTSDTNSLYLPLRSIHFDDFPHKELLCVSKSGYSKSRYFLFKISIFYKSFGNSIFPPENSINAGGLSKFSPVRKPKILLFIAARGPGPIE